MMSAELVDPLAPVPSPRVPVVGANGEPTRSSVLLSNLGGKAGSSAAGSPDAGGNVAGRHAAPLPPDAHLPRRWNELPGAQVCLLTTGLLLFVALLEAQFTGQVGALSGLALVGLSVAAALVTRQGDRSLTVMTPPLSFLLAALVAGQLTLTVPYDWQTAQPLMLLGILGRNAAYVVLAMILAAVVALVRRHFDTREIDLRRPPRH